MQTQEPVNIVTSDLLQLPPELRILILRQLLRRTPYIRFRKNPKLDKNGLQVQVLRVNKQLCREGLQILYGENYFLMTIWAEFGGERIHFVNCHYFTEQYKRRLPLLHLIHHYVIKLKVQNERDRWVVQGAAQRAANVLSRMPRIKHLHINIGGHPLYNNLEGLDQEYYAYSRVLEPFTLLRGVGRVDFSGGVPPEYAEHLKNTMEGRSPLDHLPKMYDALERLVQPFEGYHIDLHTPWDATERGDLETFKDCRSRLRSSIVERTQNALNHLMDHDAEPDAEGEWVIERRKKIKRPEA